MADFVNYELWDTHTTLGVYSELDAPKTYWLDLLFGRSFVSDSEAIDFAKIPRNGRKLAPFILPMAQGRPIYDRAVQAASFKPAYVKPSDPVSPTRALQLPPGKALSPADMTPMARYEAVKADIIQTHKTAVTRREEWMAAQAVIYGQVIVDGPDYPATVVNFGRDAGNTIVLGSGARWGDAGVSITDSLQSMVDLAHNARFGGAVNRVTMGLDAWAKARKDAGFLDRMDINIVGSETRLERGLLPGGEARYVGTIDGLLDVWVYNDWYLDDSGAVQPFMSPKDVVLTGPNADGVRAYGMILDVHAEFKSLPVFVRNYIPQNDVAIEQIVTQSAPLPVVVNPNATVRATVVA